MINLFQFLKYFKHYCKILNFCPLFRPPSFLICPTCRVHRDTHLYHPPPTHLLRIIQIPFCQKELEIESVFIVRFWYQNVYWCIIPVYHRNTCILKEVWLEGKKDQWVIQRNQSPVIITRVTCEQNTLCVGRLLSRRPSQHNHILPPCTFIVGCQIGCMVTIQDSKSSLGKLSEVVSLLPGLHNYRALCLKTDSCYCQQESDVTVR